MSNTEIRALVARQKAERQERTRREALAALRAARGGAA